MPDYFDVALANEKVNGPLAALARSIFHQESGGGRNTKTSNAGAMGGMQIIPSTFNSVADKGWDIKNPLHNAQAGIRYIKYLDKLSGGNPAITAAGYYGGPGALEKAKKGIAVSDPRNPNAPNTLQYGQQVAARMGKANSLPSTKPSETVIANAPVATTVTPSQLQPTVATTEGVPTREPEVPLQFASQDYSIPVGATPEWDAFRKAYQPDASIASLPTYGTQMAAPTQGNILADLARFSGKRDIDFSGFAGFGGRV